MSDYGMTIVYKLAVMLTGLLFAFMGYRLFTLDKSAAAGSMSGKWNRFSFRMEKLAPGVFFALFGSAIIGITVWRGLGNEHTRTEFFDAPPAATPAKIAFPAELPANGDVD